MSLWESIFNSIIKILKIDFLNNLENGLLSLNPFSKYKTVSVVELSCPAFSFKTVQKMSVTNPFNIGNNN